MPIRRLLVCSQIKQHRIFSETPVVLIPCINKSVADKAVSVKATN